MGSIPVSGLLAGVQSDLDILNVQDFGAVGDGTTDDSGAIQDALDAAVVGQTVCLPPGSYKVNAGLTMTKNGVKLCGGGGEGAKLIAGTAGLNTVTLTGRRQRLERLQFQSPFVSTSASANITLDGAGEAFLHDIVSQGGFYGLRSIGGTYDSVFDKLNLLDTYGGAHFYVQGGSGNYIRRCKLDQMWPAGCPVNANLKGAWAASTVYATGDVVISNGYYLQCTSGGTSGTVAPGAQVYGIDITDGTVTWRTANNANSYAFLVESDSFYQSLQDCDMTGAFRAGFAVKNSHAGTAPQKIIMERVEIGEAVVYGGELTAGAGFHATNCTVSKLVQSPSNGLYFNGFTGDVIVQNCLLYPGYTGIQISSGRNTIIGGNVIAACTNKAVSVAAGVSHFIVAGNNLGSSATWGANGTAVAVANGASDYYNIVNNVVNGNSVGGIVDGGTGTNKTVSGNV
ncbi:MAG: glycosyl hydrolase family 28-related protein [Pseudomonadota bacterium]|nr:glycosyl hydrolase family 28-related protein [Pseudomonadota bacterium]